MRFTTPDGKRFDFRIRAGNSSVIRVDFGHSPEHKDFWPTLMRCLQQVSRIKKLKPVTAIDIYGGLDERNKEFQKYRSIPSVISESECEIEVVEKVTVRHKVTGIMVVKECRFGSISETIIKARLELTDLVTVVYEEVEKRKLQLQQEGNKEKVESIQHEESPTEHKG